MPPTKKNVVRDAIVAAGLGLAIGASAPAVAGHATATPVGQISTEMISLAGYSLGDLRNESSQKLADAVQVVLRQVEVVRANLSGPPGRVD